MDGEGRDIAAIKQIVPEIWGNRSRLGQGREHLKGCLLFIAGEWGRPDHGVLEVFPAGVRFRPAEPRDLTERECLRLREIHRRVCRKGTW